MGGKNELNIYRHKITVLEAGVYRTNDDAVINTKVNFVDDLSEGIKIGNNRELIMNLKYLYFNLWY